MDEGTSGIETESEVKESEWLEPVKNAYKNCDEAVFEGRKMFGRSGDYVGSVEVEYDVKARNEVFEVIDQLRDRLPSLVKLSSEGVDFSPSLGTPQPLVFRNVRYFVTNTHERYAVSSTADKIDSRFDPESEEFLGIETIRKIKPRPLGVNIVSYETKYLRESQVKGEIEELISAISTNLTEEEREIYLEPLRQKISALEVKKLLVALEGRRRYGNIMADNIGALLESIPEKFKKQQPEFIFVGRKFSTGEERSQDITGPRELFYSLLQRKLFLAEGIRGRNSNGEISYTPDQRTIIPTTEIDWYEYGLLVADKMIDHLLPKKYYTKKFIWRGTPPDSH